MKFSSLVGTLKFRIIALAATASVLTAVAVTSVALQVTQSELTRQLLDSDRLERERTAALLGSKLATLKNSLQAVASKARPDVWRDQEAMTTFLLDKPALSALFDGVFAAAPDGTMLARTDSGQRATALPNIADRDYFRRVMSGDQPVLSEPLVGKASKRPIVIVAVPVIDANGVVHGTIAGALRLQSNSLFSAPITRQNDEVRDLVVDQHGVLLWHTDTRRVMGRVADEPGLAEAIERLRRVGNPTQAGATAELSSDSLVSMARIPQSDWQLVRLTPRSVAMASMAAAERTAWATAAVAGLLTALVAGAVAWAAAHPIGLLRDRAERLLQGDETDVGGWPRQGGEIGAMSRAFQRLLLARERQREELQAVLDNADIGLALTRDGRFETVSRQFCVIFGFDPTQVVGQPSRMIYASDAAYEALSERARPAFMEHGLFDGEVELVRHDGQPFWARMRGRAVVPGDRSKGTIWVIADVTKDHEQHERLHWAAHHDRLTGLVNRAAFEVLLERATESAAKAPFCAMFIDLDRFKQVNDAGGHAAGDALLRGIAQVLTSRLRKSDTVSRLGGDEFAVVLPQCPIPQAQALAEALRNAVDSYRLEWDGQQYSVGASIGLVAVNGIHASAAEVLCAADAACYAAKRGGRNQVSVASG